MTNIISFLHVRSNIYSVDSVNIIRFFLSVSFMSYLSLSCKREKSCKLRFFYMLTKEMFCKDSGGSTTQSAKTSSSYPSGLLFHHADAEKKFLRKLLALSSRGKGLYIILSAHTDG